MKKIAGLILLALSAPAWATDRFACDVARGTADGSSPSNCRAWPFPDNTFVAGDRAAICGLVTRATTSLFTDAGSAGSPIELRGDLCPGEPGILDGAATADPVLQLGAAGLAASYVRVTKLKVQNSLWASNAECILDSSLGAGGGFNEFIDVDTSRCGAYNILLQKPSPIVDGGRHNDCGDDCIAAATGATSPTIRNTVIELFSTRTTTGDGIFINDGAVSSNALVELNTIYWDNPDGRALEKQAMIVGVASGTLRVRYNRLIARTPTAVNHAIAVTGATDAIVEGNLCIGWNACVTHFTQLTEGIDNSISVLENMALGSQYLALLTPSVGTPKMYVDHNIGVGLRNGLRATSTVLADLFNRNNSFGLDGLGGDALYVSNSLGSYTGGRNSMYPAATGFIENYECGGSAYATIAAYVAACTQDAGSISSAPLLVGGSAPSTVDGFRPVVDSPHINAGSSIGVGVNDYDNQQFDVPPTLGPFRGPSPAATATDSNAARAQ